MARIKYNTIADALKDMKPGEYKDVRVNKNLISVRKGQEGEPKGLTANLYTPPKRAKVITK